MATSAIKRAPMMLTWLALFSLAVSLQTSDAYEQDKVYKYDFEGSILTRVADDEKPQFAGVALKSVLLLKKTGDSELAIKLQEPQMATFNQVLEDVHRHQYAYKPMERAQSLDKPFRIYFGEEGGVRAFDTYKDEPKWVTNFKRGLLAFFQLRLKEDPQEQYYSVAEKSVFGECETDYLVLSNDAELNVTKTRNMAKCKTRFLHRFMPIDASECVESEKDLQQYKHSNAIFNYQLQGSRKDFTIRQVLLDEQSTFSPFGQKAHSHLVHTKFLLRLNSAESGGSSPLSIEDGAAKIESLSYDPPEMANFYANINLDEEHHLSNIYQTSATVDQVLSAFDALVQEHRAYTSAFEGNSPQEQPNYLENSNLASLFRRLNELVGTMNSRSIEQLYSQVDERGEAHKKIFWDLMSVVGTNPSFSFMKKLISEGDAPSVKIKDFLARLSYHIKMPSKALFDEYVNLCKSDKIQTNQPYKRLCSLPLASLIHQHCAKPHAKYLRSQQEGANATAYKKAQNTCQIATAEEYFASLVQPIRSSSSAEELSTGDKMFNIKMAGELGVKPSIDYLIEVVRAREEHPSLRAAAMWNMKKAAHIYPAQVKRLVVPYLYDQSELLELRIAAFYNWFSSGLSLHELETLSKQLMMEPSRQLVVYMHSMIKSLAELQSTAPCTNHYERNARLVLPILKKALKKHAYASFSDSQVSLSSQWLPDFGYGTASLMSVIYSNESMAPANLFYSSSEIMSGLKLNPMSVSVQAHGLDKLIKRVVGINGLLADKESFMDVFSMKRRNKRQASPSDLIKQEASEIGKELKLGTREFSDVYLAVTVSAYGRIVSFFDKDSRELKKMLSEDGTIKIPQIKKLLHSFNNHTTQQMMITFEKMEVFNNELGLPLYQSISDFDYKTFKLNTIKLDVEPGFFKDERQGKPPTKITAALDAKMGRHNEMLVSTGALLLGSRQKVGVAFHKKKLLQVPLKMALDANLQENKISIKRQPIHENLLYIRQYPLTFISGYDPSLNESASSGHLLPLYDLKNRAQMKPFKLDYMTPLAVGIKLEGVHRAGQDWSMAAWRRHLNSVGLQAAKFMYMYSPTGAPMELRLSTVTTQENPTKDLTSQLSWRHYHDAGDSSKLGDVERELETFTNRGQAEGTRPTSVQYRIALVGGSAKERKVALDISYSRSADRLLHKWRAFYQRTPLEQENPQAEATNLCWLGQLQFPKYQVDKLLKFDLLQQDHSANMSAQLTFGDQCEVSAKPAEGARVAMQLAFDWSAEQREMIEQTLGAKPGDLDEEQRKRNNLLPMYRRCLEKREQGGALVEGTCLHLLYRMTELNHLQATIDYKDVPERWTKLMGRLGSLYTYARAGYIDEMDDRAPYQRDYKSADGKQDRAHLEANLTSTGAMERKLSYEFDTPKYHVIYRNLPVSFPPLSSFPLLGASYYQTVKARAASRFCSVSQNSVTTFDNLTYTMPQVGDGCFKLIAKDCSPEQNYIVLGAKVGSAKVVKVYVANKFKVEFVPDKDGKRVSDVRVNGQSVQVEPEKKPVEYETNLGPRQVQAFQIDNNGAYYTLDSKLYKFSVSTDGTWILVQQSKYYAGKSCGICGDSNGDQLMELKAPGSSNKLCRNTNDFVWSYVLPSTCASRPTNIECA